MREACEKLGVSPRTLRNWLHKWDETGLLDKNFKRVKKDKIYDCMRNLTPDERDFVYNRDSNVKIPEWINGQIKSIKRETAAKKNPIDIK